MCRGAVSSSGLLDSRLVVCSLLSYALWVDPGRCCILQVWSWSSVFFNRINCPYLSSVGFLYLVVLCILNSGVVSGGFLPCVGCF